MGNIKDIILYLEFTNNTFECYEHKYHIININNGKCIKSIYICLNEAEGTERRMVNLINETDIKRLIKKLI